MVLPRGALEPPRLVRPQEKPSGSPRRGLSLGEQRGGRGGAVIHGCTVGGHLVQPQPCASTQHHPAPGGMSTQGCPPQGEGKPEQ